MVTKLAVPEFDTDLDYPESDGEPLGETDIHALATIEIFSALRLWFESEPTTYVAMDNFVYYIRDDNRTSVSPDVYVVKGVGNHRRRVYKTWEGGKGIDVVFEVSSKRTHLVDLNTKRELYDRQLGVREYYVFDPEGDFLEDHFCAFARGPKGLAVSPLCDGHAVSRELGLDISVDGYDLRFADPTTGERLLTIGESARARKQAESARKQAENARQQEEAARRTADAARQREEAARRTADAARQQAERALAELRAEYERLKKSSPKHKRSKS